MSRMNTFLEYWNLGVMELWVLKNINPDIHKPLFQDSIIPI